MQVEIQIDSNLKQPKLVIYTSEITDEIRQLLEKLNQTSPQMLTGIRQGNLEILEQEQLIRIYASNGKVFAEAAKGTYQLRMRLYELEEILNPRIFVRISNSEIINLKQAEKFDLSFSGTICVTLSDGTVTYVSRRYVSKIKQVLGI
ncbi:MAG: LytTR family DNA-binding domain-containing protein [Massiliimalia sp.]|jgi:DNA-binding LytR/AlgR family response regulator